MSQGSLLAGSSPGAHDRHIWTFRLQLQDATGSIPANVYGPDGDTFFTVKKVSAHLSAMDTTPAGWQACWMLF